MIKVFRSNLAFQENEIFFRKRLKGKTQSSQGLVEVLALDEDRLAWWARIALEALAELTK